MTVRFYILDINKGQKKQKILSHLRIVNAKEKCNFKIKLRSTSNDIKKYEITFYGMRFPLIRIVRGQL